MNIEYPENSWRWSEYSEHFPNPLCPSCGVEPHKKKNRIIDFSFNSAHSLIIFFFITVHIFSCSSHPTLLTELDLWERPRLASEFLYSLHSLSSASSLFLPLSPLLLPDKRVGDYYHHQAWVGRVGTTLPVLKLSVISFIIGDEEKQGLNSG